MSIESKSPSVYQYAAQPYPSFPTTPFLSKPINYESQSPFTSINNNPIQSNLPINYIRPPQNNNTNPQIVYPIYSPTLYQPISTPPINNEKTNHANPSL